MKATTDNKSILVWALVGALVMLLAVNFFSNNFFGGMMSQRTCALMHGNQYNLGFWLPFLIIVIVIIALIIKKK